MLLGENILLAVSSIKSNKVRAFLTMLGIIIGIASVIAILTVGNSLTRSVEDTLQGMGSSDIYISVTPRNDDEIEYGTLDGISYGAFSSSAKMSESDYITSEMVSDMCDKFGDRIYAVNISDTVGSGTASSRGVSGNVSVIGASAGYFVTNKISITAGSMFSARDFDEKKRACLVSEEYVDAVFNSDYAGAVGRIVEVKTEDINEPFTIVGVYKDESQMGNMMMSFMPQGSMLYIPLKTSMSLRHKQGQYSDIRVSANIGEDPKGLAEELQKYFEPYYRGNDNYKVTAVTFEAMVKMLKKLLNTITTAISIIAGIALVVGGIGVMNIMLVSVTERTREIGTRKALGAKNSSIRVQFIVEAIILCLIGGFIGMVLGIVSGMALANHLGYPARPSVSGIIISIGFSVAIGLFFGYFPANKAAKMNPIDALRYE